MCLLAGIFASRQEARKLKFEVAEKDIFAIKSLIDTGEKTYGSPIYTFKYELNRLYANTRITKKIDPEGWSCWVACVERGFHAYLAKNFDTHSLEKAIARCKELNIRRDTFGVYYFRVKIPKGSKYLISIDGSTIVSDKIIILRKI